VILRDILYATTGLHIPASEPHASKCWVPVLLIMALLASLPAFTVRWTAHCGRTPHPTALLHGVPGCR
jgi:hypothetical protein